MDRNFDEKINSSVSYIVVPYVGTWIEISIWTPTVCTCWVVPYVGTWIEICDIMMTRR